QERRRQSGQRPCGQTGIVQVLESDCSQCLASGAKTSSRYPCQVVVRILIDEVRSPGPLRQRHSRNTSRVHFAAFDIEKTNRPHLEYSPECLETRSIDRNPLLQQKQLLRQLEKPLGPQTFEPGRLHFDTKTRNKTCYNEGDDEEGNQVEEVQWVRYC